MKNGMTAEERLEICFKCPYLKEKWQQCRLCGCFVQAKARVPFMHCPDKRW